MESLGISIRPITRLIPSVESVPCSDAVFLFTAGFQLFTSSIIMPEFASTSSNKGLTTGASAEASRLKSTISFADRVLPGRAFAGFEIKFEIEITARRLIRRPRRLVRDRRPAQVRVQDDAGRVDDAPQLGPQFPIEPGNDARRNRLGVRPTIEVFTLAQELPNVVQFPPNRGHDQVVRVPRFERLDRGKIQDGVDRRQVAEGVRGHGRATGDTGHWSCELHYAILIAMMT